MAIKQTQTKLFDFSDVGLDFCAGSKNLFPDRFKKMLALGYNEQTVSSVAVAGNQVTFTYGGTHGYVADRVLKVNAPELLGINGGEFVIDSVTANTVTMTIDGAPASIAGNFTTKVASLGWGLVYELENIQVYKFKHIDESDMYVRLCFQNNASYKNLVGVCIGRSFNENGAITDIDSIELDTNTTTPILGGLNWCFGSSLTNTHNFYSYNQGAATYGKALVVGSKYHLIAMYNNGSAGTTNSMQGATLSAILPIMVHNYAAQLPLLIAQTNINPTSSSAVARFDEGRAFVGKLRCIFDNNGLSHPNLFQYPSAPSSFTSLDEFNTTTAEPIAIYESATGQHLGYILGGLYRCRYSTTNTPPSNKLSTPSQTIDIDLNHLFYTHLVSFGSNTLAQSVFVGALIEEIKIA